MSGPVGPMPAALAHLDDTLLDAQMSADSQVQNTTQMLEAYERILADGRIDEYDADEVLYLRRHTLLEHELNGEQCTLLSLCRWSANETRSLVQGLRGEAQERQRAAATRDSLTAS